MSIEAHEAQSVARAAAHEVLQSAETQNAIASAVEHGLTRTLLNLGIDASTPDGQLRAQRNFRFLDELATSAERIRHYTLRTIVVALCSGLIGLVVYALSGKLPSIGGH